MPTPRAGHDRHSIVRRARPLAFIVLGQAASTGLSAQDTINVTGEITCPACEITLDTILTISGPELLVDGAPGVTVDRRGRIHIAAPLQPEVLVFDSTGAFVRTVGRGGEGPGEYLFVSHTNVGPNYIHVFDPSRGRTLLDQDFEFVRIDRFDGRHVHSYVTESEDVIFSGDVFSEASAGHNLHILSPSGEMSSFGGSGVFRGQTLAGTHSVAADSRTVWVVESSPNRITRWDLVPEPGIAVVYNRFVDEFDQRITGPHVYPDARNASSLLDDDGLWILWSAHDPEYTPRRGGGLPTEPPQDVRDSWLDLVDPETGLTLARHHSDGSAHLFAYGSRYVVFYHETDAGEPYIILMEPHLTRGPRMRR